MREIKFRGMLESGEWLYGGYVKIKDGAHCILSGECNHYESDGKTKNVLSFNAVKFKTVGEYTGLKDKNGKEIYEGDIVFTKGTTLSGQKWERKQAIELNPSYGYGLLKSELLSEVIGNIYENPEILESK